jgi:DNA-binding transcriptional LysR family regulator
MPPRPGPHDPALNIIEQRLSLRNLRLIEVICREGSLVRAAQGMNMTQSAVTKALQELEAAIGVQLFERTNRGALPTPFGEALAAHARVVMTQIRHATLELAELRDGAGGSVAIGTLLSASVRLLPQAMARVLCTRPNLRIRIVEGTNESLMPQLRRGDLDMVVGRLPEFREREGIRQERLMEDEARIVAGPGHPLVQVPAPRLEDLVALPWIMPGQDTTLRRQIDHAFRQAGCEPPVGGVESVSVLVTRALLREGRHLAVWPSQLADAEAALGTVHVLPLPLPATSRPLGLSLRSTGRMSPAALVMIEALRRVAVMV